MEHCRSFLVFAVVCCFFMRSSADVINKRYIERVKARLNRQYGSLPTKVSEILAVFDKNLHFLDCLPTKKVDNRCYESPRFCNHPSLKVGNKPLGIKFGFCKYPWTIKIGFKLPRAPWYLKWGFGPMVIPIIINEREGVVKINSVTKGDVKALGIFRLVKAQLSINGIIRWDCTKPKYNQAVRVRYNSAYNDGKPGLDYNKLYYKLHVRMEVKKKRFPCFCYRCYKDYCRDVVNKKGHFGTGPASCIKDAQDYAEKLREQRDWCRKRPPHLCRMIPRL